jgi:hypothetical protein
MCERQPGNRCSSHVKADIERKTLKAAKILVSAGVDSPSQLTGTDKSRYTRAQNEVRRAQEELQVTPEGIRDMEKKLVSAKNASDSEKVAEFQSKIYNAKELRKRRSDALKKLERAESYVKTSLRRKAAREDVDTKIDKEIGEEVRRYPAGGRKKAAKDKAAMQGYESMVSKARLNVNRFKRSKAVHEKLYAKAIDVNDTSAADEALSAIEKDAVKIAYYEKCGVKAAQLAKETHARLFPPRIDTYVPPSRGYVGGCGASHSGGCGGGVGGCGVAYQPPGVSSAVYSGYGGTGGCGGSSGSRC